MAKNDKLFVGIILAVTGVYLLGLPVDVMNIDAAQYAAMALEMKQTGSYLQVFEQGRDYLDKPPLLFWLSAFSMSIFGEHDWVYKLPSVLFTFLAAYSLFRFAILFYSSNTAKISVVVFLSSQAIFLMNNDIRTDNLLMGSCMLAIWQVAAYIHGSGKKISILWIGAGIGLGMLSKGPLGLIFPALAFFPVWIVQRKWTYIFKWEWLLVLAVAALIISPMCYGLYTQFDLQPDKIVNGKIGVSGLYFYFWEQSFGRITGHSTWTNNTGPFFFLHTYLWAFLPWILFLIPALIQVIKHRKVQPEWYVLSGMTLIFIALSLSRYKLPHYIYLTLPFAALVVARYLSFEASVLKKKFIVYSAAIFFLLSLIFGFLLFKYIFPLDQVGIGIICILSPLILFWIYYRCSFQNFETQIWKPLLLLTGTAICVNIWMNVWFYPQLLEYQSSSMAMKSAKQLGWQNEQVRRLNLNASALHFYMHGPVQELNTDEKISQDSLLVYTNEDGKLQLENKYRTETLDSFSDFAVTRLNPVFLKKSSRESTLSTVFLIKIKEN